MIWLRNLSGNEGIPWRTLEALPQMYGERFNGGDRNFPNYGAQQSYNGLHPYTDRSGAWGNPIMISGRNYGVAAPNMGQYPNMNGYIQRSSGWEEEVAERSRLQAEREMQRLAGLGNRGFQNPYATGRAYAPYRHPGLEEQQEFDYGHFHSPEHRHPSYGHRVSETLGRQAEVPLTSALGVDGALNRGHLAHNHHHR